MREIECVCERERCLHDARRDEEGVEAVVVVGVDGGGAHLPALRVHLPRDPTVDEQRALPRPTRKVDVRLPGKGDSNSHGARPVHLIIPMIKRIRTSRLSIKNSLSLCRV